MSSLLHLRLDRRSRQVSVCKENFASRWQGSQLNIDYRHSRGTAAILGAPNSHVYFRAAACSRTCFPTTTPPVQTRRWS